jgi:hypothetical protein
MLAAPVFATSRTVVMTSSVEVPVTSAASTACWIVTPSMSGSE